MTPQLDVGLHQVFQAAVVSAIGVVVTIGAIVLGHTLQAGQVVANNHSGNFFSQFPFQPLARDPVLTKGLLGGEFEIPAILAAANATMIIDHLVDVHASNGVAPMHTAPSRGSRKLEAVQTDHTSLQYMDIIHLLEVAAILFESVVVDVAIVFMVAHDHNDIRKVLTARLKELQVLMNASHFADVTCQDQHVCFNLKKLGVDSRDVLHV